MKRLPIAVLVIVFSVLHCAGQTTKEYTTAAELQGNCQDATSMPNQLTARDGLCVGFIDGYRQSLAMMAMAANHVSQAGTVALTCEPPIVTTGQVVKVFTHYIENHPEKLHVAAVIILYESVDEAFPCSAH